MQSKSNCRRQVHRQDEKAWCAFFPSPSFLSLATLKFYTSFPLFMTFPLECPIFSLYISSFPPNLPSLSLLSQTLPLTPLAPVIFPLPLSSSLSPSQFSPPSLSASCLALFLPCCTCTSPPIPLSTLSHLCRSLECNGTHTACEK